MLIAYIISTLVNTLVDRTKIINLFSGPGAGKSTMAAGLYKYLKSKHFKCELTGEFAKDLAWANAYDAMKNQFYVSANQNYRQCVLMNKVDVIISDSPIILGIIYDVEKDEVLKALLKYYLLRQFKLQDNVNIFIRRVNRYKHDGRLQNASEAKKIDVLLRQLLDDNNIKYHTIDGNNKGLNRCIKIIERYLE